MTTVQQLSLHSPQYYESILRAKLENPSQDLPAVDSINLLFHCMRLGEHEAQKSLGKDAIVVLGNTGAGKSTTINYLFGCKMQKIRPQEIGFSGFKKVVVVQPTSIGGTIDEIMPIGHKATQSQTFIPQIATDNHNSITYIDCPGFLDNRGAEINIANSLNIKKAIKNCRTVRVVILIGYHSLVADRSKGLRDLMRICYDLFSSEEAFLRNGQSIHM